MISGKVQPIEGQRGMNARGGGGAEHWSRRPPRAMLSASSWAKKQTHRLERRHARRGIMDAIAGRA